MAVSMILIKEFQYRGDDEEWSNRYYLTGADPTDNAGWLAIFNALAAAEKVLYPSTSAIVRAYGYTSDAEHAATVYVKDLKLAGPTIPGTLAISPAIKFAGDQAGMIYWKTSRLNSRGKAIYLRKFMHDGYLGANGGDSIATGQKTGYETFATLLASGAGVDGRHIRGVGQATETIFASGASPFVTTRTLKRRGKRPTSP